jgi:acetyl esterase/lipase
VGKTRPTPLIRSLIILSSLFAALPACSQESSKIKVEKDVSYWKVGKDKDLQMDIAVPQGNGPFPAVVCVHGGAWRQGLGKRQDLTGWIERLAEEGYVAATVSYRLLPDAKFPEPIEDCKTAVRFLRANADKYHIDKNKIGALGFSAGGHLVSLLGVAGKDAGFEGTEYADQSSKVQAVVSFFGPTDLSLYGNDESAENSTFVPLLGGRFKDKPEAFKNASPITHVTKNAPPFLFLHGTKDWLVPIAHSRSMYKKLKDAGASAEIVELEGAGHSFEKENASKATSATLKFLAEKLKQ